MARCLAPSTAWHKPCPPPRSPPRISRSLSRPWDPRFDQPDIPSSDDFSSDPAVWDMVIVGSGVAGSALAYR